MPNRRTVALSAAIVVGIAVAMGKPQMTFPSACAVAQAPRARLVSYRKF